jgi:hypothetical protein
MDGSPDKAVDCATQQIEDHVVASLDGCTRQRSAALPMLRTAGIQVLGSSSADANIN